MHVLLTTSTTISTSNHYLWEGDKEYKEKVWKKGDILGGGKLRCSNGRGGDENKLVISG